MAVPTLSPAAAPPPPPPPPPPLVDAQPPAFSVAPPPAPAKAAAAIDDFGFDFGEEDGDRFGAMAPSTPPKTAAPHTESSAESDEDLWSEVSLRGVPDNLLESPGPVLPPDLTPQVADEHRVHIAAPGTEVLFEDDTIFEEVSTAHLEPPAPPVEETFLPEVAAPALAVEEPPAPLRYAEPVVPIEPVVPVEPVVAAQPVEPVVPAQPVEPVVPAERLESVQSVAVVSPAVEPPPAALTIDQTEIERIVAARLEDAVRQALAPMVADLARTMIESVAWEVVPGLAEAMIRSEIERIRQSTRTD